MDINFIWDYNKIKIRDNGITLYSTTKLTMKELNVEEFVRFFKLSGITYNVDYSIVFDEVSRFEVVELDYTLPKREVIRKKSDTDIAFDMLDRYKELSKENPQIKFPDVSWMHELLKVVREANKE